MVFDNQGSESQQKLLRQLLEDYSQANDYQQKLVVAGQIVQLALQFRSICRKFKNQELVEVLQELYDQARLQLQQIVTKQLDTPDYQLKINCQWLNESQNQVFRQLLNDQKLKELALLAQQKKNHSEERAYFLTELVRAMYIYNRFCRPYKERFKDGFYDLIYEEAFSKTSIFICLNINRYDPHRGAGKFMTWVNFLLDKEVLRCRREFDLSCLYNFATFDDLSTIYSEEKTQNRGDVLYECIKRDLSGRYKKAHIQGNPQGNFQKIALARLDDMSWEEIATEVGSPASTAHSFYRRYCIKFKQLLREELENMPM